MNPPGHLWRDKWTALSGPLSQGASYSVVWRTVGVVQNTTIDLDLTQTACHRLPDLLVDGGVRIHPGNAGMSGRHGVQYVAQCVACAALTLAVWQ